MLHRIPKLRQKYLNISVKRKGLRQLYAITPQHIRIRSPLKDYRDGSLCPVGYCLRTNTLYGDVFDINLFYRMVRRELVYLIVNFTGSLDSPLEQDRFEPSVPLGACPACAGSRGRAYERCCRATPTSYATQLRGRARRSKIHSRRLRVGRTGAKAVGCR